MVAKELHSSRLGYNAGNSRVRGQNAGDLSRDPLCLTLGRQAAKQGFLFRSPEETKSICSG